jgi:hypothetical protein
MPSKEMAMFEIEAISGGRGAIRKWLALGTQGRMEGSVEDRASFE